MTFKLTFLGGCKLQLKLQLKNTQNQIIIKFVLTIAFPFSGCDKGMDICSNDEPGLARSISSRSWAVKLDGIWSGTVKVGCIWIGLAEVDDIKFTTVEVATMFGTVEVDML